MKAKRGRPRKNKTKYTERSKTFSPDSDVFVSRPEIVHATRISCAMTLQTEEGTSQGFPGDWLVTTMKGEAHFVEHETFLALYERRISDKAKQKGDLQRELVEKIVGKKKRGRPPLKRAKDDPEYASRLQRDNDAMKKWNSEKKDKKNVCDSCEGEGFNRRGLTCEVCLGSGGGLV